MCHGPFHHVELVTMLFSFRTFARKALLSAWQQTAPLLLKVLDDKLYAKGLFLSSESMIFHARQFEMTRFGIHVGAGCRRWFAVPASLEHIYLCSMALPCR